MAKTKKNKPSVKKKKSLSSKSKTMAHAKKRKSAGHAPKRRRSNLPVSISTTVRRRRKKGLFDASGSALKVNAIHSGAGMLGGGAYGAGSHLLKHHLKNHWLKAGAGLALAIGIGMAGMPFVAAGAAGAAGSDLMQSIMEHGLNDGEMSDVEYVHPSTLSDSGLQDEEGNMMLMDADGMCYAPDHEGTYHAVGDRYSLSDGMDLQSVAMIPLQEAHNPYNLSEY